MYSYLQHLAQVFANNIGSDFSKYTFVFPNHRAGLFFRRHLLQATDQVTFTPKIYTINECFASLSDLCVANQLTLLLRLYRIYKQHRADAEPLEEFLYWGKMMLADFSEIDNHRIDNVAALYGLVKDMHDIDMHFASLSEKQIAAIKRFWNEFHNSATQHNNSHMHKQFLRTWELLYPLYQALQEDLLSHGMAYEGLLHRHVIEHWKDIPLERFSENYVFVGFNAMTKTERELMLQLQEMGRADFYFDYNHDFLRDEHNVASRFMADNQLRFQSKYPITVPDSTLTDKNIHLITTSSSVKQTHQVHEILQQLEPNDANWSRTAVVLPNEELLIPLLHTIPSSITNVNVTMGYPLRATGLYKLIAYPEQEIIPMPTDPMAFIAQMRVLLHERYEVPPTVIINEQNELETEDNYDNSASVNMLLNTLDCIENAIQTYSDITFSVISVQQILKMLTMEMTIPYSGEPEEGLQIMGVLETRALDFDNIIITDFNDDIYPGHARNNSFIPYSLRRGFDLPTIERQDAIFAYNFYRMLSHAKNIWFIANTHADDQHSGELSRYYYQLLWQYQLPIQVTAVTEKLTPTNSERKPIVKSEKVLEQLSKYFSSTPEKGYLSASALCEYLRCPKAFYYKYLERIQEPEIDESISVSSKTVGLVLHAIMQHLYQPYEGKMVQKSDVEKLMKDINDEHYWHSLEALQELQSDELAEKTILSCINNALYYDYHQAPFLYIASEQNAFRSIYLPSRQEEINFFGKIDRIDIKANHLRIIDYKTGSVKLSYNNMAKVFGYNESDDKSTVVRDKGNKFILQTLLYCWLLENNTLIQQVQNQHAYQLELAPHLFPVRQLQDETTETCLHDKTGSITYTTEIAQEFQNELINLLEEVFDPSIALHPTADGRQCADCYLNQICQLTKED
jgi:phage antirepressor YoqD-like protein